MYNAHVEQLIFTLALLFCSVPPPPPSFDKYSQIACETLQSMFIKETGTKVSILYGTCRCLIPTGLDPRPLGLLEFPERLTCNSHTLR